MRFTAVLTFLATPVLLVAPMAAVAHEAHTTRIETRPYYGAIVTIEQGVRVYRPVPPTTHLIINPDGATPLKVEIEERAPAQRGGR